MSTASSLSHHYASFPDQFRHEIGTGIQPQRARPYRSVVLLASGASSIL